MKAEIIRQGLEAAKTKAAPAIFWIRKHAPEILVATGIASIGGGTVLACKATLDAKVILEEEVVVTEENEEECKREAVKRAAKVAGKYAPAAGLLVGGTAMLVAAKSIEHRRFTAALGAYSSMQTLFDQYRERVAAEYGEEAEERISKGVKMEKADVLEEQEDGKKPKRTKVELAIREDEDPFHRIFDECNCPHEWRKNLEENLYFLACQEKALNNKLQRVGRVFLNEVYDALGFEYLPIGQFVGWVADDREGYKDGYIDFGIDYGYLRKEVELAQQEGRNPEPSIWLNFNCDGEVWDNPMKKRYDS